MPNTDEINSCMENEHYCQMCCEFKIGNASGDIEILE